MTDTRTTHPVRISRLAARPGHQRPWVAVCGGCEWATAEPTQDEAVASADAHQFVCAGCGKRERIASEAEPEVCVDCSH